MRSGRERPRAYYGLMLLLTGAIVGVFCAQDLLLFYVFWEAMLIPLYLLVGVWGGEGRQRATLLFVIYTMAGSLLMLASIIVFGLSEGTFDLLELRNDRRFDVALPRLRRRLRREGAAVPVPRLAAVRVPRGAGRGRGRALRRRLEGGRVRLPLHRDRALPRARPPTCGCRSSRWPRSASSTARCSRSGRADVRGVIAYSSLAQLGLIMLGLFATNLAGWNGALLQMVNHGLISVTLFMLAGLVEARAGTGSFDRLGGMARGRPALATVLMVTGVIALAVPGSTAFAGEFLILTGVFDTGWGWAVVGAIAIVLAAMYMLRLISAVLHERAGSAVRERRARPAPGRAGRARAARGLPARVVGLAGGDHRPQLRPDGCAPALVEPPGAVRVTLAQIATPSVDWYALAPLLILLAGSGLCVLAAVLLPESWRLPPAPSPRSAASSAPAITAAVLFADSERPESIVAGAAVRDRLGSFSGCSSARSACWRQPSPWSTASEATAPSTTRSSSLRPRGWCSSSRRRTS